MHHNLYTIILQIVLQVLYICSCTFIDENFTATHLFPHNVTIRHNLVNWKLLNERTALLDTTTKCKAQAKMSLPISLTLPYAFGDSMCQLQQVRILCSARSHNDKNNKKRQCYGHKFTLSKTETPHKDREAGENDVIFNSEHSIHKLPALILVSFYGL